MKKTTVTPEQVVAFAEKHEWFEYCFDCWECDDKEAEFFRKVADVVNHFGNSTERSN